MTFSLMTLRVNDAPTPVLCIGDRHWAIADVAPEALQPEPSRGLMNVFDHWERTEPLLFQAAESLADGSDSTPTLPAPAKPEDILAPLLYPRKAINIGGNYLEHMHEDADFTEWSKEKNIPQFFMKPPTTAIVGSGKSVKYPIQTKQLDYEVELAVVIGKTAHRLTLENAMEHVAGYTVAMDLSARDWQLNPKHVVQFDLFNGKAFDDSCPLGPGIVPARFIDPSNVQLKLTLNGVVRQDGNSRDMMWNVPEILVLLTEHVTLEPGDVLSTGCPSGVGYSIGLYVQPGDVMDAEISGIGNLHVEVQDL